MADGWMRNGSTTHARPANMVAVPVDKLKQLQADRDELLAALEWMLSGEESDSCEEYRALVARIKAGK